MEQKESDSPNPLNGLQYHVIGSLSDEARSILDSAGAKKHAYLSEAVSYAISDITDNVEEYSEAIDIYDIPVVSGEWVKMSLRCNERLPAKAYQPLQLPRLFSGKRMCVSHLLSNDQDALWAMVTYYGGCAQRSLDETITHLVTTRPFGRKYNQAMTMSNIKIVSPDWVVECINKKAVIDEANYHPKMITNSPAIRRQLLSSPVWPTAQGTAGQTGPLPIPMEQFHQTPVRMRSSTPPRRRHASPRHRSPPTSIAQSMQQGMHPSMFHQAPPRYPAASHPGIHMEGQGYPQPQMPQPHNQQPPHMSARGAQPMTSQMPPYMTTRGQDYTRPGITPTQMIPSRPPHRPVGQQRNQHHQQQLHQQQQHQQQQQHPQLQQHPQQQPPPPQQQLGHQQPQNSSPVPTQQSVPHQQAQSGIMHMMTEVPYPSHASLPEETPIIKMTNMAAFPMRTTPPTTPNSRKSLAKSTLKNITNSGSTTNSTGDLTPVKSPGKASKSSSNAADKEKSPSKSSQPTPPAGGDNVYFGYDMSENVPGDMCLVGCIFYMGDYLKTANSHICEDWTKTIEQHGGTVDPSYSNRVTHVLVETQHSDVCTLALNDHKRVVTAYWLNDVLGLLKMEPPWQAYHLPHPHMGSKVCSNQIIGISGFEGAERAKLKVMIGLIGASFTSYLARSNSVLICKKLEGQKALKAKEWGIPIVNVSWLSDLVLGHAQALKLPVAEKYKDFGKEDDFLIDASSSSTVMAGWRVPLKIPKDCWRKFKPSNKATDAALEGKRKAEEDLQSNQSKRFRLQDVQNTRSCLPEGHNATILLTGFNETDKARYTQMIILLGGKVSTKPEECTHVIAEKIVRTPNFLLAMNYCMFITSQEWITESSKHSRFLDERLFSLHDSEAGSMWNLLEALESRRSHGKPFIELSFYLTPGVASCAKVPLSVIHQFIEAAGGSIQKSGKRWSAKRIQGCLTTKGKPGYIVVTCRDDSHLCLDLMGNSIDVYTVEFILSGIMLQRAAYENTISTAEVPALCM